ncbi:MAG TPA: aldehyde dehydrogenase family protein, partial [Thermoplasmatales archaeon]|nr:aldehyde dehydrogenase family protein [Thermoplasmatales archaeon]
MTLKSINPATGETLETFEEWSDNQVDEQISKTREAFSEWRETSFAEREKLLMNMAKVIRNRAKKYAELITTEMGKPIIQAEMEVEKCADACEYFAKHGRRFLEDDEVELDKDRSYIRFIPLGVILGVMPWNFPFWQVFRWAVPSVLAGNVLLLKHSSNVPRCGFSAEEIFTDAGFPENVFKFLPIGSKKAEKIIG